MDHVNVAKRDFKQVLEAAGLPDSCTLYSLRHSCATLLLSEGVHPKVVSERLGHANITTTLQTYAHVLPTMQEKAVEVLDRLMARPRSQDGRRRSKESSTLPAARGDEAQRRATPAIRTRRRPTSGYRRS